MKSQFLSAIVAIIIIFSLPFDIFSTTSPNRGASIVIGGSSGGFTSDESLLGSLEPDNDSIWGANEEINDIFATWDKDYFYVGLDGISWGNGIIIYLQAGADKVLSTAENLDNWSRKITFPSDFGPNYFISFWDQQQPALWKVLNDKSAVQITESKDFKGAATINQSVAGAIVAKISWHQLFPNSKNSIPIHTKIKICAVVVGGIGQSGADIAPDNSVGIPQDSSNAVFADNYIILPIDSNGDSQPDMGVSPDKVRTFKYSLPFSAPKKIISNLKIEPLPFSPNKNLTIAFNLTNNALVKIEIFDLSANLLKTIQQNTYLNSGNRSFNWDGTDLSGNLVKNGLYILKITINNKLVIKRGIAFIK